MSLFSPILWIIAFRNLVQHSRRNLILGAAIGMATAALILLTGVYTGIKDTLLVSSTTLMSGHINVAGFYKANASQGAPIVAGYKKVKEAVIEAVPELDYIVQRGRGWAKLISETGSMQAGLGGIELDQENRFRQVIHLKDGDIEKLKEDDTILIFEEQATKLDVKVGDKLTIAATTQRGASNTADVTVIGIAKSVGMMSSWNTYMSGATLRKLYQLNDETTGALQVYLKDIEQVKKVQERLRKALTAKGFDLMDPDPRAFFFKFDVVNRESWTGQKLDITTWEEESSFVDWIVTALVAVGTIVITLLLAIIGVGLMNVMWISVRERTREVGTLRAVGMQRTGVLAMFVAEAFLLGLLGTLAGAALGLVGAWLLTWAHIELPKSWQFVFFSETLVVTPTVAWLVRAVLFITASITLVSLVPSLIAARLKPVSAMSHVS